MAYPKWKYRKHPDLGIFQSTLVLNEAAEKEIGASWSEDPASTGFKVRPVSQLHPSHFTDGLVLHEAVSGATQPPVAAEIHISLPGDVLHLGQVI